MPNTINNDGLLIRFGNDQGVRGSRTAVTTDSTKVNEMMFIVDLAGPARTIYSTDISNSGANNGFGGLDTPIPLGAKILSQDILTLVAPAGGTNFVVGTYTQATNTSAPVTVDDDGIVAAGGANGAQIGSQATAPWYVTAKTTGTYTAGRVKVIVRYLIS